MAADRGVEIYPAGTLSPAGTVNAAPAVALTGDTARHAAVNFAEGAFETTFVVKNSRNQGICYNGRVRLSIDLDLHVSLSS